MFEIKNKIEIGGLRTKPADYNNQVVYDRIRKNRFCASWLHSGGKYDDHDGFILWMMNIPYRNPDDGKIIYASQDDAEDTYDLMSCGKMELESSAAQFISQYEKDKGGYLIIPTKDLIKL